MLRLVGDIPSDGMLGYRRRQWLRSDFKKPKPSRINSRNPTPNRQQLTAEAAAISRLNAASKDPSRFWNPSHLQAVHPVVEGRTRAQQWLRGDERGQQVLPLLVHGDAALAGQGVTAETLNLSQLEGYATGGSVHVILNSQVGFTAGPRARRSGRHATDVVSLLPTPIFRVNADHPEACVRAAELALDFCQRFGEDVVIDLLCYRRHGPWGDVVIDLLCCHRSPGTHRAGDAGTTQGLAK